MQKTSLSGWLFRDALFYLTMILTVFPWNCLPSQIHILYIKQVPTSHLFGGIIYILQHKENEYKSKEPQRNVRLLTGVSTNVLTWFVCSVKV